MMIVIMMMSSYARNMKRKGGGAAYCGPVATRLMPSFFKGDRRLVVPKYV